MERPSWAPTCRAPTAGRFLARMFAARHAACSCDSESRLLFAIDESLTRTILSLRVHTCDDHHKSTEAQSLGSSLSPLQSLTQTILSLWVLQLAMFSDIRQMVALFNKDAWKNTVYGIVVSLHVPLQL